jgi:hypothetical protein
MGSQATPTNAPTQVYYDPEKQQYFSYKPAENSNPIMNMFANTGMPISFNGQKYNTAQERMYLNNPYISPDRFKTNAQATPYAELTNLFPSLNAGLSQNTATSLLAPTDTQSSGAGRFLASSNNSQGK